jgi:archaellin
VYAGLQKTRGAIELRGGVVVQSSGCPTSCAVSQIQFQVSNTAGGDSVSLDPSATTNKTVIGYQSGSVVNTDMTYTVSFIGGNGDNSLDPGEIATVTLTAAANAGTIGTLVAGDRWSFIVESPTGATLDVTRTLPAVLQTVMQVH